jgi:CHASE2 domain-containing sensor protein
VAGDIFLSYSRNDSEVVGPLVREIERRTRRKVWWDRGQDEDRCIRPGTQFPVAIREAFEEVSCCIVLVSSHSVASEWVRKELGYAEGLPIFPVFLARVDLKGLPSDHPMRVFHTVDVVDLSLTDPAAYQAELQRLLRELSSSLWAPVRRFMRRTRRLGPFALPFVAVALLANFINLFDYLGVDARLSFLMLSSRELVGRRSVDPHLVLVVIDERTDAVVGESGDVAKWRAAHAQALDHLHGAKVVAYDITFDVHPEASEATQRFADSIRSARTEKTSVVLGVDARDGEQLRVDSTLRAAVDVALPGSAGKGALGHVCMGAGWQLITSYVPVIARQAPADPVVSLALAAFTPGAVISSRSDESDRISVRLGGVDTPLSIVGYEPRVQSAAGCPALNGSEPVRYYLDLFPYDLARESDSVIPFEELLEPTFDPARITEKTVLIGSWRHADADHIRVWDRGPRTTSALNVHAAAINTLLSNGFVRPVTWYAQLAWLAILAAVAAVLRNKSRARRWLVCVLVLDLALAVGLSLLGIFSDVLYQLLVILLSYVGFAWSLVLWRKLRARVLRLQSARPRPAAVNQ